MEHAQNITKIGMRGLFRIPLVDIASHSTPSLAEVLSSEGGTTSKRVSHGKYRVGKVRVVNTEDNTECISLINRQELDTLLDTDAPECTALVWLQGEVKDALFDQMLKGS